MSALPQRRRVLFAGGCCLLLGAVGEEGLDGPAQRWVCLVDCARITKDTDVLNPGNNHLDPRSQQNTKTSNLYVYVNSNHDSKTKLCCLQSGKL